MSDRDIHGRLLLFEVGGSCFALPISSVLEVAEPEPLSCIPTLPMRVGGAMNYHGDALPVIRSEALLELDGVAGAGEHVLVVKDRLTDLGRLGMPVDRVHGLVDGQGATATGPDPVAEKRHLDRRLASVLDPRRLLERAEHVIERVVAGGN